MGIVILLNFSSCFMSLKINYLLSERKKPEVIYDILSNNKFPIFCQPSQNYYRTDRAGKINKYPTRVNSKKIDKNQIQTKYIIDLLI